MEFSIIKNKAQIATTEARQDVLTIIEAGVKAVDPKVLMKQQIIYDKNINIIKIQRKTFNLIRGRIFVIGGGKAAGVMADALEEILGAENISAGVVNAIEGKYKTKKIKIIEAGHPLPNSKGAKGVGEMLRLKHKYDINDKDLVICLISGGGSALMPAPVRSVSLKDMQHTTELLLSSGANIREINTVRKHLSAVKGGRLGEYFAPAQVASIIISDVIGNDPDLIASGPTIADPSTFKDAWAALDKYRLLDRLPKSVYNYLGQGCNGDIEETPKELSNSANLIIGDINLALEAMALEVKRLGYKGVIATAGLEGDPGAMAMAMAKEIKGKEFSKYDVVLMGGETTPALPPGHGQGGRNQHYVAATLLAMADYKTNYTMASFATDGQDYEPGIGGAIVDNMSLNKAKEMGLEPEEYLKAYNSHEILDKMGDALINTDATGTNVCDIIVYLLKK